MQNNIRKVIPVIIILLLCGGIFSLLFNYYKPQHCVLTYNDSDHELSYITLPFLKKCELRTNPTVTVQEQSSLFLFHKVSTLEFASVLEYTDITVSLSDKDNVTMSSQILTATGTRATNSKYPLEEIFPVTLDYTFATYDKVPYSLFVYSSLSKDAVRLQLDTYLKDKGKSLAELEKKGTKLVYKSTPR